MEVLRVGNLVINLAHVVSIEFFEPDGVGITTVNGNPGEYHFVFKGDEAQQIRQWLEGQQGRVARIDTNG